MDTGKDKKDTKVRYCRSCNRRLTVDKPFSASYVTGVGGFFLCPECRQEFGKMLQSKNRYDLAARVRQWLQKKQKETSIPVMKED